MLSSPQIIEFDGILVKIFWISFRSSRTNRKWSHTNTELSPYRKSLDQRIHNDHNGFHDSFPFFVFLLNMFGGTLPSFLLVISISQQSTFPLQSCNAVWRPTLFASSLHVSAPAAGRDGWSISAAPNGGVGTQPGTVARSDSVAVLVMADEIM